MRTIGQHLHIAADRQKTHALLQTLLGHGHGHNVHPGRRSGFFAGVDNRLQRGFEFGVRSGVAGAVRGTYSTGRMLMIWLAAKIYRIAIFATGKKPSMAELVRWMRAS